MQGHIITKCDESAMNPWGRRRLFLDSAVFEERDWLVQDLPELVDAGAGLLYQISPLFEDHLIEAGAKIAKER